MASGGTWTRVLLVTSSLLPLCLAHACGGQTRFEQDDDERGGRGGKTSRPDASTPDASEGGEDGEGGSGGERADSGPDAPIDYWPDAAVGGSDAGLPVYDDPGCPDAAPPEGVVECDAFNEPSGCAVGEGCYPYVDHPFGDGCGLQTFGAVCIPAGTGVQGSECGEGTSGCSAGFICVVGTQAGKRCTKICDLNAPNTCGNGLICGATDVEGVGVCA